MARPFSNTSTSISRCGQLHAPITPMCTSRTPAVPILVIKKGDAGEREITLSLGEFLKGPAPMLRPERQVQFGNNLVRLAHCRQWPREEFAGTYGPSSCSTDEGDLGIAGHGNPGQFGGRVGMGKAAADGAAVAESDNARRGRLPSRNSGFAVASRRSCSMSRQRTRAPSRTPLSPTAMLPSPGTPAQIDQHAQRRQPEGENRNQALPAGDHGCLGIRHEQVDRFPECGWGLVFEGSWFIPLPRKSELSAQ